METGGDGRSNFIELTHKRKRSDDSDFGNTSSTSVIVGKFDVFLSFRSIDTGKSFTDFLNKDLVGAGILTFLDDNELRAGEEIGPKIMEAIEESKICIPILSQNYASSKWCLLELAQMVECKRRTKLNIKPIFYDVKPCDCDVSIPTGSYEEAFRQHEERFDKKTVQRWKEALKEVGELKGWELQKDTNGHQGELVEIVVEDLLLALKKNCMVVTDKLVGTDHHFEEMKGLLNVDSNDVRIVGIHGMGGLGKTTIAKVVYNKLSRCFDCCCFLVNVREMSRKSSDFVDLQKQFISKIRKGKSPGIANVDDGISMIRRMAHNKKVLIVLDDVDEKSQIANLVGNGDCFGPQSRIIITTRDKMVLNYIEKCEAYEPQPMKYHHALQLFSKHAFRSDFPPEDYISLSQKVVSTAGGLPFALESIGSFLFGECKEVWEGTFEKLRDIPDEKVQKKLRISYDGLSSDEKQIFLDIACYLIGVNKTLPFYMWNDLKHYPRGAINILVHKSLVKIGDNEEFGMHDQHRDLGREIVRQENIENPEERSRLWIYDEALDILNRRMGTKNVEALCLQRHSGQHIFTKDEFGKLPNLRFLQVDCTDLIGDFVDLLSKLRWLQWHMCTNNSNPNNFHLRNLVILDLSYSCITENWDCWSQIKTAKKLKVLVLSYCEGLATTPDLSNFVMLKELDLCGCDKLVEVRGLTGLKSLENLDMSSCKSLERLPDLSNLVMLKGLHLSECGKLIEVRGLTGLKSLENLDMSSCKSLERLPDLSNLVMLKGLHLSECGKLIEVRGLTGLKSLERLNLSGCNLFEGLLDLSNLKNLKELKIRDWKNLTEIRGREELESLTLLDISGCEAIKKGDSFAARI